LDELTTKWETIKASVQEPFQTVSSAPSFSTVQQLMEVYFRATVALNWLEDDFEAWQDFVKVYRNLQQSLLELSAFLDWWKDVSAQSHFRPSIRSPTRGTIFKDECLYANHAHYSVGAFLLIHKSAFTLNPAKKVRLSPCNLCKEQPMSPNPIVHTLQLWYYPPQVQDIGMDLETAARGYSGHLDTFNPAKGFKCKLDKVENKTTNKSKLVHVILFDSDSWPVHSWLQIKTGQDHHVYLPLPFKQPGAETYHQHWASAGLVPQDKWNLEGSHAPYQFTRSWPSRDTSSLHAPPLPPVLGW
jgi:hypothetical protein